MTWRIVINFEEFLHSGHFPPASHFRHLHLFRFIFTNRQSFPFILQLNMRTFSFILYSVRILLSVPLTNELRTQLWKYQVDKWVPLLSCVTCCCKFCFVHFPSFFIHHLTSVCVSFMNIEAHIFACFFFFFWRRIFVFILRNARMNTMRCRGCKRECFMNEIVLNSFTKTSMT